MSSHTASTIVGVLKGWLNKGIKRRANFLLATDKPLLDRKSVCFGINAYGITDAKTYILDEKWYPLARISYKNTAAINPCLSNNVVSDWDDIYFCEDLRAIKFCILN